MLRDLFEILLYAVGIWHGYALKRHIDGPEDGNYHDRFCEQDAEGRCFCDRRRLRHIDGPEC